MFSRPLRITTVACCLLAAACGGDSVGDDQNTLSQTIASKPTRELSACSRSQIEQSLTSQLTAVTTDTDFSFYLEDENGKTFTFERGESTLNTLYQSASTSKWVSAAVILQLVDRELLTLQDTPQVYLTSTQWSLPGGNPLNTLTLSDLLSFTSGLNDDVLCNNLPQYDFFECVKKIADKHADTNNLPGTQFSYGSNHLQVAGAMAVSAGGYASWAELFNDFKSVTGLFPNSYFNMPSLSNPRLAGGMTWTAYDYVDFIRAFRDADIYSSPSIVALATTDHISDATIVNSPANSALDEEWHYGFGLWLECHNAAFLESCATDPTISSPGAYGAYPFLNTEKGYFGLVARQGELGTFRNGYAVFDSVRKSVEDWVGCTH